MALRAWRLGASAVVLVAAGALVSAIDAHDDARARWDTYRGEVTGPGYDPRASDAA